MQKKRLQFYHKLSPKKGEKEFWSDLYGSGVGFSISSLVIDRPLLVITPDILTSLRLEHELTFFLDDRKDEIEIDRFPGWEILPYDHFSPYEDIVSNRLSLLSRMISGKPRIVLVDIPTLMHRLPPKKYVESNSFVIKTGEVINPGFLRLKFEGHGYNSVTNVMEHGEFAVRGSIIDVFPMGSKLPYRIDLFDTTVDSIRFFDVDTQRTLKVIDEIKLLPAKEFPLDEEGIETFCNSWGSYFGFNKTKSFIYQSVSSGKTCPGIECYLPLFFKETATLFDYFPSSGAMISIGDIEKSMDKFWEEIGIRYEQLRHDYMRPILDPKDIFFTKDKMVELKEKFRQIEINNEKYKVDNNINHPSLCFKSKNTQDLIVGKDEEKKIFSIKNIINENPDIKILFTTKTAGRREALLKYLQEANLLPTEIWSWHEFIESENNKVAIAIAPLEQSLNVTFTNKLEVLLVTGYQIFGDEKEKKSLSTTRESSRKIESIIRDLTQLQVNDPVVHTDYGVGRYLGLKKLQVDNQENEFLELEYAKEAKVYVPITSLDLISRYTGVDSLNVPLNHLGSKQWEKTKRQAKEKIRDTAAQLLEIYARRLNSLGFSFVKPQAEYDRFVKAFPFVTTFDQEKAIETVVLDMISNRSMDRLICGDVGFGKTEVAMRAAFLAVYNGKQVAILAPTTLLVQQHFINFEERFSSWPVKIALFSRFSNTKDQKMITEELASGKIDIVIGTHKLLQKSVKFKNLGLLVVDEEHRFGVRQKETIKSLAKNIDILSLTATPIPRTLNMAFVGIRDFSIISTPPAKRLTIKTFLSEYNPYLIKEAILRETLRGGQVYFLHNNIANIEKIANDLKRLVPDARIAIAHGQMRKQQLEKIMRDFYHQHINVLVCTTIIESGIDVPTANTIIMNRADKFGLAQLHQLRGRVGRSHYQAYAYLITPPKSALTKDAKKRLDAIMAMKDLGTGFILATNDLEIRGAGELLGEKQSGIMQGIGFSLYMDMLKNAINTIKGDEDVEKESIQIKTEIDLKVSALIPDKYINDVNLRLVLYKRIAECKSRDELTELQIEIIDRFGRLPEQTKNLFKITSLKLMAEKLDITKIIFGKTKGIIEFKPDYQGDINIIIPLLQKHTDNYKFSSSNSIEFTNKTSVSRLDFVEKILADWLSAN